MGTLKKSYLVTKRNVLNQLRANSMSLQELRFFSIYLSKINARDEDTRVVRFSISDFQRIMELGRIKMDYLQQVTDSLLCKVINVHNECGGYDAFQLFKECSVKTDEFGEWYIEIDAHDKALPLLFGYQKEFFKYKLWNALRLKSSNQLRMYEILKQYEKIGSRVLTIEELRTLLGIEKGEYERFNNFKSRVLDSCQAALAENTDIKFTYEPYGKRGAGGKILALKFTITKNNDYVDQLTLEEFIDQVDDSSMQPDEEIETNILTLYSDACDNEFDDSQIQVLYDLIIKIPPYGDTSTGDTDRFDYLRRKYHEMIMRKPNNRFGYLRKLIELDFDD